MNVRLGHSSRIWRIIRRQQLGRLRNHHIRYCSNKIPNERLTEDDRSTLEEKSKGNYTFSKLWTRVWNWAEDSILKKAIDSQPSYEDEEASKKAQSEEAAKAAEPSEQPGTDTTTVVSAESEAVVAEVEPEKETLQQSEHTQVGVKDNLLELLEEVAPTAPKRVLPSAWNFLGESFDTKDENLYNSLHNFTKKRILCGAVPPIYQLVTDQDVPVLDQEGLISLLQTSPQLNLKVRPAPGEDASNTNWLFAQYLKFGEFPSGVQCAQQLGCTKTAALKWRRAKIDRLIEIIPTSNFADGATGADRAAACHDPNRFQKDTRNFFHRVGDHSPSWKPGEIDATKDPFDSYLHPHGDRNGGAPDLNTVDPRSFYGYANYLGDEVESYGTTIKVVPSEHGKFRMFLTDAPAGNEGVLDISTCKELRNNHFIYDRDRKTYVLGLCSRSRVEFFKSFDYKALWNSRIAQLDDFPLEYLKVLYKTAHSISYSRKPLMVLMCGDMSGPAIGLGLHCAARLMDAGTRLRFDHAKRGSFFEMGVFHRLQYSKLPYRLALYYALTGHPIPAWEMMYYNLGDWMVPDQNGPLLYHYMGEQIDSTFLDVFKEQDKFRHRAMLRNVIELFDRGQEHYAHNSWRRKVSTTEGKQRSIEEEIMEVFPDRKSCTPRDGIKQIIERLESRASTQFWAREALESIRAASPISVLATYCVMAAYYWKRSVATLENNMHLEIGVLMWMQEKGDFWEGVRSQVHQESGPERLWRHKDLNDMLKDENYRDLGTAKWLADRIAAGKEILGLKEIPEQQSLFYPRAAPKNMTWENTAFADAEVKDKTDKYYADYMHLRGPCHPAIEKKLTEKYTQHWRELPLSAIPLADKLNELRNKRQH